MASKFTGTLALDNAVVENRHFSSDPLKALSADKVQPLIVRSTNLGFAVGATPTTREECVYVARGDGDIRGFHALLIDTGTSTSVTFDFKKNGTTVLSAVITITNATTDADEQDATLSVTTFVAGDRLSVAMTVSSSTGAVGPVATWVITEDNAPAS